MGIFPKVVFLIKIMNLFFTFLKYLFCEEIITALEHKASFDQILKEVIGEEVDTRLIPNVYGEIYKIKKQK
jgi:hypothetical protein